MHIICGGKRFYYGFYGINIKFAKKLTLIECADQKRSLSVTCGGFDAGEPVPARVQAIEQPFSNASFSWSFVDRDQECWLGLTAGHNRQRLQSIKIKYEQPF